MTTLTEKDKLLILSLIDIYIEMNESAQKWATEEDEYIRGLNRELKDYKDLKIKIQSMMR